MNFQAKVSFARISYAIGLLLCLVNCRYAEAILVAPGETFSGSGVVSEELVNQGSVIGNGPGVGDRLVFDAGSTVSGAGYFENTLVLGSMSPGNSPGIVTGTKQAFGGTLVLELGGTTPGFGGSNLDQINDYQTLSLFSLPTLSVVSFGGYIPTPAIRLKYSRGKRPSTAFLDRSPTIRFSRSTVSRLPN